MPGIGDVEYVKFRRTTQTGDEKPLTLSYKVRRAGSGVLISRHTGVAWIGGINRTGILDGFGDDGIPEGVSDLSVYFNDGCHADYIGDGWQVLTPKGSPKNGDGANEYIEMADIALKNLDPAAEA